ncbi:MAG TPA: Ku protein [Jiangellaceae bacterium]|nr:Ku protein [Jiangellaceae bacterium]
MATSRSIWKGSLTFGLVNVPIRVHSATEDHDIRFHQVHHSDGGRIRYRRTCEVCGEQVGLDEIDKAYDADDGRRVVLDDDDFEQLPAAAGHEIEVLQFVPNDQLDPIMFDRAYYLAPDSRSPKAYVLLRRTLEKTDRTAIVHFALRQKTRLAALRVRENALMVQTMLWPDEVRPAEFEALENEPKINDKELQMSASLVESMSEDFDPAEFHDEYQEQLRELIDAKLEGGEEIEVTAAEEASAGEEDAEVLDLVAALRRSVAEREDKSEKAAESEAKAAAGGGTSSSGSSGGSSKKSSSSKKSTATKSGSSSGDGSKSSDGASSGGGSKKSSQQKKQTAKTKAS